jgi:hypothetical protein
MMRLILFILLMPTIGIAQIDSTVVSIQSIINAAETINMQKDSIAELNSIIDEMVNENRIQSILFEQQAAELDLMSKRVVISDGIVDRYLGHVEPDKWFDRPNIRFMIGLLTAYVSSLIYKNIR